MGRSRKPPFLHHLERNDTMAYHGITTRTLRRLAAAAAAGCASAGAAALPATPYADAGLAYMSGAAQHCITSPGLGTDGEGPPWGDGVTDPHFWD